MATIKLYHYHLSTPSRSAIFAIRNLGIDVELIEVNLLEKEQMKEDYIRMNPQHTVPLLDDNGFYLTESKAIATYLLGTRFPQGNSLYPADIKLRSLIDSRLYFDTVTFYPKVKAVTHCVRFEGQPKVPENLKSELANVLGFLDAFLEGKTYLCGDAATLADVFTVTSYLTIVHIGFNVSKYNNIARWFEACKSLPGFEENEKSALYLGTQFKSRLTEPL